MGAILTSAVRRRRGRGLCAALCVIAALVVGAAPASAGDECWLESPGGFQRMGGQRWFGPYASYDEAQGVNRSHFQGLGTVSCTRTPPPPPPPPTRTKGVVTVVNRTSITVRYAVRRRADGAWLARALEPGQAQGEWQTLPAAFSVEFDASFDDGYQPKSYGLAYDTTEVDAPTTDHGRRYHFAPVEGGIDLFLGDGAPPPPPPTDDGDDEATLASARLLTTLVNLARGESEQAVAERDRRRFATSWMRRRIEEHGRWAEAIGAREAPLAREEAAWRTLADALVPIERDAAGGFERGSSRLAAHLAALHEAGLVRDAGPASAAAAAAERAVVAARPAVEPAAPDVSFFPPDDPASDVPDVVVATPVRGREPEPARATAADVARLERLLAAEERVAAQATEEGEAVPYETTVAETRAAVERTARAKESYVARHRAVAVLVEETSRRLWDLYVERAKEVAVEKAQAWLEDHFPLAWREGWASASVEVRAVAEQLSPWVDAFRRMRDYGAILHAQTDDGGLLPALLRGVAAAQTVHVAPAVADAAERDIRRAWSSMGDRLLELGLPEPVHEALSVGSKLLTEPERR
ncbi:MAG: hypothetical protein IT460_18435 [Planctomycetes bacterium]|nr:hypothetical protein [Planctomycetota bacterium]